MKQIQCARRESVEIDGSGDSKCGCSIDCLQKPFTSLSYDEKVGIIEKESPMSDFQTHTLNLQYKKKFYEAF